MENLKINGKEYNLKIKLKTIILCAFIFYLICIVLSKYLYYYFFQVPYLESIFNFIPFKHMHITDITLKLLMFNVILFIPAGIFYKISTKKRAIKVILFLLFSFTFELSQALTKLGIFDITTIIFNTIGFLAGIFVFVLFKNDTKLVST